MISSIHADDMYSDTGRELFGLYKTLYMLNLGKFGPNSRVSNSPKTVQKSSKTCRRP